MSETADPKWTRAQKMSATFAAVAGFIVSCGILFNSYIAPLASKEYVREYVDEETKPIHQDLLETRRLQLKNSLNDLRRQEKLLKHQLNETAPGPSRVFAQEKLWDVEVEIRDTEDALRRAIDKMDVLSRKR